jgi:quercetin dioxygenase-like cupin family protein
MKSTLSVCLAVLAATFLSGCMACCDHCPSASPFAKYNNVTEVQKMELKRTSESWDGTALPDYLKGKPELVVMRYVFPVGSKLPWHHHPVINYGILQQGELTIVGLEGQRQVVRAGDAIVEMVGPIHCGMNTGDKPIVLDMFYLAQDGMPLAVQHPEVQKPME